MQLDRIMFCKTLHIFDLPNDPLKKIPLCPFYKYKKYGSQSLSDSLKATQLNVKPWSLESSIVARNSESDNVPWWAVAPYKSKSCT